MTAQSFAIILRSLSASLAVKTTRTPEQSIVCIQITDSIDLATVVSRSYVAMGHVDGRGQRWSPLNLITYRTAGMTI